MSANEISFHAHLLFDGLHPAWHRQVFGYEATSALLMQVYYVACLQERYAIQCSKSLVIWCYLNTTQLCRLEVTDSYEEEETLHLRADQMPGPPREGQLQLMCTLICIT